MRSKNIFFVGYAVIKINMRDDSLLLEDVDVFFIVEFECFLIT